MNGSDATLYGVGVGPGDPELMTLKAVRIIQACDLVALPGHGGAETTAFSIAAGAVPGLRDKPALPLNMPMLPDRAQWSAHHDAAARIVVSHLQAGRSIAFLTLGDPSVYSTYLYLHRRVLAAGRRARIIPGVPSFCAAAALTGGLVEGDRPLHVVPAPYGGVDEALGWGGTTVLMKAGRHLPAVRDSIRQAGLESQTRLVTRCGMEGERVYDSLDEAGGAGYFSLFIIKKDRG